MTPSMDTLFIFFNGRPLLPSLPLHLQSMVGRNGLFSGYKSQRTKGRGEGKKRKNPKTEKKHRGGQKQRNKPRKGEESQGGGIIRGVGLKRKKKEQTLVPLVSSQRNRGDERTGRKRAEPRGLKGGETKKTGETERRGDPE